MATRSSVTRETLSYIDDSGKTRAVIVTVNPVPGTISLRLKGTRRTYELPVDYLYWHALKRDAGVDLKPRSRIVRGRV